MESYDQLYLNQYIMETLQEFNKTYNIFQDKEIGPIRQRAIELHSAIVTLLLQLCNGAIDSKWLPKHTFVILSQLQDNTERILEELDLQDNPVEIELDTIDNVLEGMFESYEDIKLMIEDALDEYRRSTLSLVNSKIVENVQGEWYVLQVMLVGTDVWRRILVPESCTLENLHWCIQTLFDWSGQRLHGFVIQREVYGPEPSTAELSEKNVTIKMLHEQNVLEFTYDYDYGSEWEIHIRYLYTFEKNPETSAIYCLAGGGAAPPEQIGGLLRFRRFVSALHIGEGTEFECAQQELGKDFNPDYFDKECCNARLVTLFTIKEEQ
jgi:hypothetical protein